MYTTGQIFECFIIFLFTVINLFCALRLQFFDKKYSINVVVLSNSITILNKKYIFQYIFKMYFIPVMQSWIFSVTGSFRNHLKMQIWCPRQQC